MISNDKRRDENVSREKQGKNQGQSKKQEDLRDGERRESEAIAYITQNPIRGNKETMFTGNAQTTLSTFQSFVLCYGHVILNDNLTVS